MILHELIKYLRCSIDEEIMKIVLLLMVKSQRKWVKLNMKYHSGEKSQIQSINLLFWNCIHVILFALIVIHLQMQQGWFFFNFQFW